MAVIRCLTNDDLLQYQHLASICYNYAVDTPPTTCTEEELRRRVGVFREDGTLLSAMINNHFSVRFEGQDIPLVGIGSVVTDPVARRQGGIRHLFETYLPALYDEGYVFSALFPFSHVFYRKFGYEFAFERRVAEFSARKLRDDLCEADEIVRVLPGEDDQGMRQIYERYIEDKHFAVRRDDVMWRDLCQGTPWEKMKYAYVLKRGGVGVAYWIGVVEKHGSDATLMLMDMAYTCRKGYEAIFAMLRGMNEVGTICMTVPAELNPRWLVKDPYDVAKSQLSCCGMLRVMNVEKALGLLAVPPVAGRLTIEVADVQIAQNNDRFMVACDGRELSVTRARDAAIDMRCSINGLSALMSGLLGFKDSVLAGHVTQIHESALPFAAMLFPQRKAHLNWDF